MRVSCLVVISFPVMLSLELKPGDSDIWCQDLVDGRGIENEGFKDLGWLQFFLFPWELRLRDCHLAEVRSQIKNQNRKIVYSLFGQNLKTNKSTFFC